MLPVSRIASLLVAGAVAFTITACGGGSSGSANPTATTPTRGQGPGGIDFQVIQKAQQCLQAAGIDTPDLPNGPQGTPPAGFPTDGSFPSPGATPPANASRPAGQGLGAFNTPQARAALKACGITLPTAQPGANGP
jgi:hypothetical protein